MTVFTVNGKFFLQLEQLFWKVVGGNTEEGQTLRKDDRRDINLAMIPCVLHTNCPVFIRSCMHSVLHASCPASGPARILSCTHRVPHPVLHASCPASGPACILSCTHRVLHASCPASALSCIKNKILFRIFLNINNDKRFNFYVNE